MLNKKKNDHIWDSAMETVLYLFTDGHTDGLKLKDYCPYSKAVEQAQQIILQSERER